MSDSSQDYQQSLSDRMALIYTGLNKHIPFFSTIVIFHIYNKLYMPNADKNTHFLARLHQPNTHHGDSL